MNLGIFGATGPTGQLVTREALAQGHDLTLYVRNPSKVIIEDPRITVIEGELADTASIDAAVAGQDAILSVLGPIPRANGTPVADGMANIVAAMEKHQVKRLVATATPSASDAADNPTIGFRLAVRMVKTFLPASYQEIVGIADAVRGSDLDWTLVRLPMLTDKHPPTTWPAVGLLGDKGIKLFSLSRRSLATFLVKQLSDPQWIGASPVLSNG